MARTYPISLEYNQCLGAKEDPYSFSSMYLEDLRNGGYEYIGVIWRDTSQESALLLEAKNFLGFLCAHQNDTL